MCKPGLFGIATALSLFACSGGSATPNPVPTKNSAGNCIIGVSVYDDQFSDGQSPLGNIVDDSFDTYIATPVMSMGDHRTLYVDYGCLFHIYEVQLRDENKGLGFGSDVQVTISYRRTSDRPWDIVFQGSLHQVVGDPTNWAATFPIYTAQKMRIEFTYTGTTPRRLFLSDLENVGGVSDENNPAGSR